MYYIVAEFFLYRRVWTDCSLLTQYFTISVSAASAYKLENYQLDRVQNARVTIQFPPIRVHSQNQLTLLDIRFVVSAVKMKL